MLLGPVGVRTRDAVQEHHRVPVPIHAIPSTQPLDEYLTHDISLRS
jgi:hypothetical protein